MRKLYMIILGMLGIVASGIQAENLLIKENRVWEYYTYKGHNCKIERFCFDGVQEHGGKEYAQWKLISRTTWSYFSTTEPVTEPVNSVVALLREEEGKVYMLLNGVKIRSYDSTTNVLTSPFEAEGEEVILYDFTVAEGDTFQGIFTILWAEEWSDHKQPVLSGCSVIGTKPMQLNNGETKMITVQSDAQVALVRSIDKIESSCMDDIDKEMTLDGTDGFDGNLDHQSTFMYAEVLGNVGRGNMTSMTPSMAIFLTSGFMDYEVCCLSGVYDADGTVIYGTKYSSAPLIYIEKENANRIFDLNGREVSNPVPGSVYIRGGKKFVAQ